MTSAQLVHCEVFMPDTGLPAPAFLTDEQVCTLLGIKMTTLESWRASKQIRQWAKGVERPWRLIDVLAMVDRKHSERQE